jgi:hypothetical protein
MHSAEHKYYYAHIAMAVGGCCYISKIVLNVRIKFVL